MDVAGRRPSRAGRDLATPPRTSDARTGTGRTLVAFDPEERFSAAGVRPSAGCAGVSGEVPMGSRTVSPIRHRRHHPTGTTCVCGLLGMTDACPRDRNTRPRSGTREPHRDARISARTPGRGCRRRRLVTSRASDVAAPARARASSSPPPPPSRPARSNLVPSGTHPRCPATCRDG